MVDSDAKKSISYNLHLLQEIKTQETSILSELGKRETMSQQHEVERLAKENAQLRAQLAEFQSCESSLHELSEPVLEEAKRRPSHDANVKRHIGQLSDKCLTVVVIGASGHLARTKTYPALFELFTQGLLPHNVVIVGFARSQFDLPTFHGKITPKLDGTPAEVSAFLARCTYFSGGYGDVDSFKALNEFVSEKELAEFPTGGSNRVFYFAIPPSLFSDAATSLKQAAMSQTGWNRMIVEKPFGKDLQSSDELSKILLSHFDESELYRIDHYLGKEMVQNLFVLRFANQVFEPLWNRNYISNVIITFKEDAGVDGRGGYFDDFGIIRDVMQNHLMQILSLVAMESPVSLDAEDIRDEKVKVLRAMPPLTMDDIVVGQYEGVAENNTIGYTEDPTVPDDSVTPTFAMAVLKVNNPRWAGVPFILKCGKGLNERKAEVRIQFKHLPGSLFGNTAMNELVLRVQPKEAIYLKMLAKSPGLSEKTVVSELDLSYNHRFSVDKLPDAYERLVLDVVRGDHRLFVRNDELENAWKIFTPILHKLEGDKVAPIKYPRGSRGPDEADAMAEKAGYVRYADYTWPQASKM